MKHSGYLLFFLYSVVCAGPVSNASIPRQKIAVERKVVQDYTSGLQLYQVFADQLTQENGRFVSVPVDYDSSSAGTTDIYVAVPFGIDRHLPTVIVFLGGPGDSLHQLFEFEIGEGFRRLHAIGFNVVVFDQRGIALSRPSTQHLYESPEFYSSVFTALDADEIRKSLGIQHWSVFGGSYGTVPATIYASLFPDRTSALVLAATMYTSQRHKHGDENTRNAVHNAALRMPELRELAELVHALPDGLETVFKRQRSEAVGSARQPFHIWLDDELFERGAKQARDFDRMFRAPKFSTLPMQIGRPGGYAKMGLDYHVLRTLTSKELKPDAPYLIHLQDFPFTVPTTYLHGLMDARTTPGGARQHFRIVSRGRKQLLFDRKGGHVLSSLSLSDEVFGAALRGEPLAPLICDEQLLLIDRF